MANSDLLAINGVRLAAVSAGIKKPGRLDLVLLELVETATVAATFTRNAFCAAPVQVARAHTLQASTRYLLHQSPAMRMREPVRVVLMQQTPAATLWPELPT